MNFNKKSQDDLKPEENSSQNILTYTDSSKEKSIFRLTDEEKPVIKMKQKYSISSTVAGSSGLTEAQRLRLDARYGLTTTEVRISEESRSGKSIDIKRETGKLPKRQIIDDTPRDQMLINKLNLTSLRKSGVQSGAVVSKKFPKKSLVKKYYPSKKDLGYYTNSNHFSLNIF